MLKFLHRTWAEIDLDALENNLKVIRQYIRPETAICATVKADAYGHGAPAVARKLQECGVQWLSVSNVDEAVQLRREGIRLPILILGFTPVEKVEILAEYEITQCVFSVDYAKELSRELCRRGRGESVSIHVKIDTGMSRLGILCHSCEAVPEAAAQVAEIAALPALTADGIFTHFADASERRERFTEHQFACFTALLEALEQRDVTFAVRHCSASAAILHNPECQLDMVRPGIILYGSYPDDLPIDRPLRLRPMMRLLSVVSYIKEIAPGDTVSYSRTFRADRAMRVATIPVGYADGYPRQLSNSADVLICGKRAPVLGRVCMDQIVVDVTAVPEAKSGALVTLIGADGEEEITCDELAALSGTISWELYCGISKRVPKIYLEGGKTVGMQYDLM